MRQRTPIMKDHPSMVQVFISDICNLRCSFCVPRQKAWSEGKQWVMGDQVDRDIDDKLLDAISPSFETADWLYLTGGGEPLASKAFWRFVDGHRRSNGLIINTNGTLLSKSNIDRILAYPNKLQIGISLNAAKRQTFHKIVGKDVFEDIVANARMLLERCRSRKVPTQVFFSMVVVKDNLDEVADFARLGADLGADYLVIHTAIFPYNYEWPIDKSFKSTDQNVLADPDLYQRFQANFLEAETIARAAKIPLTGRDGNDGAWEGPCRELFDFIRITQNGQSEACCQKWDVTTGKVSDYPDFMSLWNNPIRVEMRKTVLQGKFPKQCQSMECAYYRVSEKRRLANLPPILEFPFAKYAGCSTKIKVDSAPRLIVEKSGSYWFEIDAVIHNTGKYVWSSSENFKFGGRLISGGSFNDYHAIKEYRALLPRDIQPGESVPITLRGDASGLAAGTYRLALNMMVEQKIWFTDLGEPPVYIDLNIPSEDPNNFAQATI